MKKILLVFVVLLIVFAGWQYSQQKNTDEKASVSIGALLPLTGSGANYGKSLMQGIDLAVKDINSKGGINGLPLKVVYEDSKTDPKVGISAFNKLVAIDKVPLVIGSISSVILAVQPIADDKQVVLLNSSAISPNICKKADNFLFSTMVNGAAEAGFMAKKIANKYPAAKVAVFYSNNSSGNDTKDAFAEILKTSGGNIGISQSYELNSVDFKAQLNNIKESKAKIGYLIAFSSNEFANILIQSKEMGLDIQWYSYSGIETKETLELAKNAAEGVIYSYPTYSQSDSLMDNFQIKYNNAYHTWPDIYTATSYDAVNLISEVIKNNGSLALDIQKGLRNIHSFKGIFGEIRFGKKQCVVKPLMWKIIKNGKYQVYE